MNLVPYTEETLLSMLQRYNEFLWPLHVFVLAAFAFALFKLARNRPIAIWLLTAASWIFCALIYFRVYLSELTWAAEWFMGGFLLQGGLMLFWGLSQHNALKHGTLGWALIGLALFYPAISLIGPYSFENISLVGITPIPTLMLTFGLIALSQKKTAYVLGLLPLSWAGFTVLETIELEFWIDLTLGAAITLWFASLMLRLGRQG